MSCHLVRSGRLFCLYCERRRRLPVIRLAHVWLMQLHTRDTCDTICFFFLIELFLWYHLLLVLFCSICFPILISLLGPCNYWDFYWKNHNASVIHKINSVIAVGSVYFINLKTFLVKQNKIKRLIKIYVYTVHITGLYHPC